MFGMGSSLRTLGGLESEDLYTFLIRKHQASNSEL